MSEDAEAESGLDQWRPAPEELGETASSHTCRPLVSKASGAPGRVEVATRPTSRVTYRDRAPQQAG